VRGGHDGSIDDGLDVVIMKAFLWGDVLENALQRSNFGTAKPKRSERFVRFEVGFGRTIIFISGSSISLQ